MDKDQEKNTWKKSPLKGHVLTGYEYSSNHRKEKIRREEDMGDTGYRPGTSAPEVKRLSCVPQGDLIPNENIYIT